MLSDKEKRAWTIIAVFGIVIGYLSLSWAGVIPDQYNVIDIAYGSDDAGDNTTIIAGAIDSETVVNGIPETVIDLSLADSYAFQIDFVATQGDCTDFQLYLDYEGSMTNATVLLTSGEINPNWDISEDGHHALWIGEAKIPYERASLVLTISGDEFTRGGVIMVIASSNGDTTQNAGLIHIL